VIMHTPSELNAFFMAAMKECLKEWGAKKVLALTLGVSEAYVSNINSGRKGANEDLQKRIAKAFGYDYKSYLEYGRELLTGEPRPEPQPRPFQIVVNNTYDREILESAKETYRGIPLYESGRLAAGSNGLYFSEYEKPDSEVIVYRPELHGRDKHKLVASKVGGDSMDPSIPKNSIVVIDTNDREYIKGKIFCVLDPDANGELLAAVKRVQRWEKGYILFSDNPKYPPVITTSEWPDLCIGRVIWMWRNVENL